MKKVEKKLEDNETNYSFVKQVENTPFTVIELESEKKFILTVGKQIASNKQFDSIEEAEEYINKWDWDLIINLVVTIVNNIDKLKDNSYEES